MTKCYWNSQFNFRESLPGFQSYLESMEARSASVSMSFERLQYGEDNRQFVELSGEPQAILSVFIHGGYWRALSAEAHRFVLPALVDTYGAAANLEYRLLPHVSLTEVVEDALSGLELIAQHTSARLVVIGHSAGGHLAVMSALRRPNIVAGAVGISGLYDLTPLQWSFLREEVGLKADDLKGNSPLEEWNASHADHTLVAVGENETAEFHRQAHIFASTHGSLTFTIPDAHHMTVLDALADASSTLNAEIRTHIHRVS